jgi:ABC-2 type transport system ATP-binding protein
MTTPAVFAEGLTKSYGQVRALAGVDLEVAEGTLLGLLGPNGAGKTTSVRILATLLLADAGTARVAGHDVVREPDAVRASIGLTGQYAAVDENLTGHENLELVGRLLHLGRPASRSRADELLAAFGLSDAGGRTVRTYSGGMRRRLDLAASLVGRPAVLFLDEPTTGLDPASRIALWEVVEGLRRDGTTILLTTQYLEEADRLADRIAVIDGGRVIAQGTSTELKDRLGEDVVDLRVVDASRADEALGLLRDLAAATPRADSGGRISLPVDHGAGILAEVVRRIDAAGLELAELSLHRPSLDDVFLALTGRSTEVAAAEPVTPRRRFGRRAATPEASA